MRARTTAAVAVTALLTAACADPELAPPPGPTAEPTQPGPEQPDPRAAALDTQIQALAATLGAADGALARAAEAADVASGRAAAEDAVHALTAHPDWEGDLDGDGDVRTLEIDPLLPGPRESIPEDAFYGDQFARTLTAAREMGGNRAGRVVDTLRDPIVGDLGVWQADAAAILDQVDQAADLDSLEELETALTDIPGHATKALTYALRAVRSTDLDVITTAAERARAHLSLALSAVEELSPTT